MLTITKPSANRLDLELSGTLNADQMRRALDSLIEQSQDITQGKMLYKVLNFDMPTMGALAVEFQHLPKLMSLVGKFDKCAVLSDAAWIRTAAEIEGAVIPSLDIKGFPAASAKAAEAWLEDAAADDVDDAENDNFPV
ncbi:STAS/SEC14 domain-containing protein [Roseobacter sp.]|uniref:STAS/SEC14 domain-containing protein n=1 Tax=Roseobacter sp. TaxID=1907202 RepID=UPI00385ECA6F